MIASIGFSVIIQIMEIYFTTTMMGDGLVFMLLSLSVGSFGMIELIVGCSTAFGLVALLNLALTPRELSAWMALVFCVLLNVYCWSIYFSTVDLIDLL